MPKTNLLHTFILARQCLFLFVFVICVFPLFGQTKTNNVLYKEINDAIYIIDSYIQTDNYDSAQVWLNKINSKYTGGIPNIIRYTLTIRQAEVYYYSGLQRLGLKEALEALHMAQKMQDSILIADAYNFSGLFSANLGRYEQAIDYFNKAMLYMKKAPYDEVYWNASGPQHIIGNLAEAYYHQGNLNKALYYAKLSLHEANYATDKRAIAVAHNMLGDVHTKKQRIDSALYHYVSSLDVALENNIVDVALIDMGGLANAYRLKGDRWNSLLMLNNGFELASKNRNMNTLFYSMFLENASAVYDYYGDKDKQLFTTNEKLITLQKRIDRNDEQVNTILEENFKNETRLLQLEIDEAKQKQRNASLSIGLLVVIIVLLSIAFLYYRNALKQNSKIAAIRQKLSQDLHDDIGASLSSLQIYGTIAEQTIDNNPEKAKDIIRKIIKNSNEVLNNMGDIIWSMKAYDEGELSLSANIKNYGVELLQDKNINVQYNIDPNIDGNLKSFVARRNILLTIKEAMNNIAKYSNATQANINMVIQNGMFILRIEDNGAGFNINQITRVNGLKNMKQRIQELKGNLQIESTPGIGTKIYAKFPAK